MTVQKASNPAKKSPLTGLRESTERPGIFSYTGPRKDVDHLVSQAIASRVKGKEQARPFVPPSD